MFNQAIFDNISKKLELHEPNQQAVQAFLNHYYQTKNQNSEKLSECILSVATGVGKTYIMAAILNHLAAAKKTTNFLIVAPRKIIREKTINGFSLNKPNFLADKLTIKPPHVVDIKNFHTARTTNKNSVNYLLFKSLISPPKAFVCFTIHNNSVIIILLWQYFWIKEFHYFGLKCAK